MAEAAAPQCYLGQPTSARVPPPFFATTTRFPPCSRGRDTSNSANTIRRSTPEIQVSILKLVLPSNRDQL